MADPLSRRAAWIVAAFAAMAVVMTVLPGKAVTVAAPGAALSPRHRRSSANVTCARPDGSA